MSRATTGKVLGLDWVQTFVLKAAGDEALALGDRRFTLDWVLARLTATTHISRSQLVGALGALERAGYVFADDAPGNPEIVLHVTLSGLETYCQAFVQGYRQVGPAILKLACQNLGADVFDLARRSDRPELLVEHVLDVAEGNGFVRLARNGHFIVVRDVAPWLRDWISGAA